MVIDLHGTSGNYLSGFLGLHGLYYNSTHADNQSAGHIHVGKTVPAENAAALMEITLETVLKAYPAADAACSDRSFH